MLWGIAGAFIGVPILIALATAALRGGGLDRLDTALSRLGT
jgi:predicted PurR-regulated permease PerM